MSFISGFRSLLGAILCVAMAAPATADVIFVPADHPTIQDAIDAAVSGDVIVLDDGTYSGQGNRDLRFNGKAITMRSAFGCENCVIDAEGTSETPYRGLIFDSGETRATVIDGITIRGGATLPGAVNDTFNGGGLFFSGSSPTLRNCLIEGNACGCWGAGVYSTMGADPVMINCQIVNNHAGDDGGGVFVWNGGNLTMINCHIEGNSAVVTGGGISRFGGNGGNVDIINCNIVNNDAPFGSAILSSGIGMTVTNSIIWGNTGGDAIYNHSVVDVSHSIVHGGHAGTGNSAADPMFVSATDFTLQKNSPCIDSGNAAVMPADSSDLDLDGDTSEPVPYDMHSSVRFADGNGDGLADLDIGPAEFIPAPLIIAPETYSVSSGVHVSGGVSELSSSDNDDLAIRRSSMDIQSRTGFTVDSISPVALPTTFEVTLEASVFARSQVTQTVELFNFDTGSWEQVDSRNASRFSDNTVTIAPSGDTVRFVEPVTNRIEARVRFLSTNQRQQFSSNVDLFQWTIE